MKKYLTSLFLGFLSVAGLVAQTDMTSRIVNPSFEVEASGWDIRKMSRQGNDAFKLKDGTVYLETWRPRGDRATDGSIKQVLTDLPGGTYTITVTAQNIQEDRPTEKQTGAWVYADSARTEVNVAGDYQVKSTCVDGTMEIGFVVKGATGNYVCVDHFRLTLEEPDEETFATFREAIGQLLNQVKQIDQHVSSAEQTALDEASAEAQAVLENTSSKDVVEVYVNLSKAIHDYRFSVATPENPLDMTSFMLSPGFEDSTKGWVVVNGFASQTNDAFALKEGTYYCEIWSGSTVDDAEAYQHVHLPNGNYQVTAIAQNVQQANLSVLQDGAYMYANSSQTAVNYPGKYSLNFVVIDSVAKIGFKTKNCTGNYVCFDDFSLFYYGTEVALEEVTGIQEVDAGGPMGNSQADGLFDLTGRRLSSAPAHGLYILKQKGVTYKLFNK